MELLSAATQFVESAGHGAHVPGPLSIDGRCVLCWQDLDDNAKLRTQRFKLHLDGAAVKTRKEAKKRLDDILASVRSVPSSVTPEDAALISAEDGLPEGVDELITMLVTRRAAFLARVETQAEMPQFPPLDQSALETLRRLYVVAKKDLAALPANDADAGLHVAKLEAQLAELSSRREVSKSVDDIRDFITKLREHQRLKHAESAINTRAASTKAGELHAKHLTKRYELLVDDELGELRFRRRRPKLAQKTNKAKVEVTPLVSVELKHILAERVFSEGERTAIALACFLAELRLGNDTSGLIFDDPVSSLDHNVREHVARRLVHAAKDRQVIVFTHDLAFLADLREQAKKIQSVDCQFCTLSATDYDAGFVESDEPFGARSVKKRVGALKALLVATERHAKDGELDLYRSKASDFYQRMRSTWERFIEERMFAEVVQRLERNVTPGALSKVTYTRDLAELVHEGWRRCSNVIEAHDHAAAAGTHTFSVEEMRAELQTLVDAEKNNPKP